jgi:ATP-binding cassette subfamily B protein/ATP-binding cassette subfamily C protein/ATP-binding cassette subfamily B multidrug efflux pump
MSTKSSKQDDKHAGSLRLLMSYVFADKALLIKTLILVVIATGFEVLGPLLSKVFIDDFIVPDHYPFWPIVGIISLFILSTIVGTYLKYRQTLRFLDMAFYALDIRKRVFKHVLSLPMSYFDSVSKTSPTAAVYVQTLTPQ